MKWTGPFGRATGVLMLLALVSQSAGFWQEETVFHNGVTLGVFDVGSTPRSYRDELIEMRALGENNISLPVLLVRMGSW